MSNSHRLTRAERELELALAAIQPKPTSIDRDRLMFRAGQMAGRRRVRFWMATAAILAVCACLSLALRPKPRIIERIVHADRPTPTDTAAPATETPTGIPYIEMRQAMADRSMDAAAWGDDQAMGEPAQVEPQPRSFFFGLIKYITSDEGDEQ